MAPLYFCGFSSFVYMCVQIIDCHRCNFECNKQLCCSMTVLLWFITYLSLFFRSPLPFIQSFSIVRQTRRLFSAYFFFLIYKVSRKWYYLQPAISYIISISKCRTINKCGLQWMEFRKIPFQNPFNLINLSLILGKLFRVRIS